MRLVRLSYIPLIAALCVAIVSGGNNPASPDLSMLVGKTNWGDLKVTGRDIEFSGHPNWVGYGKVRENGEVFVEWTNWHGRAISIYRVENGELVGVWNFVWRTVATPDGLYVTGQKDRIYKLKG